MGRRNAVVRKDWIQGLGKEANRIETAQVLGVGPTGARAKVYFPLADRILALPCRGPPSMGLTSEVSRGSGGD